MSTTMDIAEMKARDVQADTARRRWMRQVDAMEPIDWQTENGPAEGGIVIETRPVTNDAGRVVATPSVPVNKATHPLEHYEARGILDKPQFEAGKRFRGDYELGGLGPRVTVNLMASGGGGDAVPSFTATDRQLSARSRFRDAYMALAGKNADRSRLAACALAVCCDGRSAGDFAAGEGRKAGTREKIEGITRLRIALDTLATHYGLT